MIFKTCWCKVFKTSRDVNSYKYFLLHLCWKKCLDIFIVYLFQKSNLIWTDTKNQQRFVFEGLMRVSANFLIFTTPGKSSCSGSWRRRTRGPRNLSSAYPFPGKFLCTYQPMHASILDHLHQWCNSLMQFSVIVNSTWSYLACILICVFSKWPFKLA